MDKTKVHESRGCTVNNLVVTEFDQHTGIAKLILNRPDVLNAVDVKLANAFLEAVRGLTHLDGLRCIVLTGVGRAFMAGGDVLSFGGCPKEYARSVNALLDALHPAILALRALDAPVVAGVRGVAAGAGLSFALMADLVIAEKKAKFLMAYDRIGAAPDCGGSWFLPYKVGAGRASELMLLGRTLSAEEGLSWGMVTSVVSAESFDISLYDMASTVAQGPTRAFGAYRRLVDMAAGRSLAEHLEVEREVFIEMTRTQDFSEGVTAFQSKRIPRFGGH